MKPGLNDTMKAFEKILFGERADLAFGVRKQFITVMRRRYTQGHMMPATMEKWLLIAQDKQKKQVF